MGQDLLQGILRSPASEPQQTTPQGGGRDLLEEFGMKPAAPPAPVQQPEVTPEAATGFMSLIGGDEQGIMQDPKAALQATRGAGKVGMGVTVGLEKPFAGLAQTALEGLSKIGMADPQTVDAFTKMQMEFQSKTGKEDSLKDAGEVFGTGISFLLPQGAALKLPGLIAKTGTGLAKATEFLTAMGVGAAQEGTRFHSPDEKDESRLADAGWGAALSAAGQAAVTPVKALGTRIANTALIQGFVKDVKNLAGQFNMNSKEVVDAFKATYASRQASLIRSQARQDLVGDAVHAGGVDTSSVVASLEKAKDGAPKGAQGAINEVLKSLKNPPIKAGGTTIPPGSPLYAQVMSKGAASGTAKYSTVRRALDGLDDKIDRAAPDVSAALKPARKELSDFLDGLTQKGGADLRNIAKEATARKDNLEINKYKEFRTLLRDMGPAGGATTPALNKRIIDIATGADEDAAGILARSLTPDGRRSLQKGIAFKAWDQSLNKEGTMDPAKFADFLKNNPNIKKFFTTPRDRARIDGMSNLVNEAALEMKQTKPMAQKYYGKGLIGWGIYDLVKSAARAATGTGGGSEAVTGAAKIATGIGLVKFSSALSTALQRSQRSESFFAAASKVKPGSPESIKLFNRFMTAFGSAAGTEGSGEGGGIRGPLLELGAEKLIEPGMEALSQ